VYHQDIRKQADKLPFGDILVFTANLAEEVIDNFALGKIIKGLLDAAAASDVKRKVIEGLLFLSEIAAALAGELVDSLATENSFNELPPPRRTFLKLLEHIIQELLGVLLYGDIDRPAGVIFKG
jgi:hypothetical protein